jgi:transposase InsO family protein
VPNRIITNNASQFTSGLFREYCASASIKICLASIAYPKSNGQAERANDEVLKGLKTRSFNAKLEACGKKWLDNLWGPRLTTRDSRYAYNSRLQSWHFRLHHPLHNEC